jgi:hypothetical protein
MWTTLWEADRKNQCGGSERRSSVWDVQCSRALPPRIYFPEDQHMQCSGPPTWMCFSRRGAMVRSWFPGGKKNRHLGQSDCLALRSNIVTWSTDFDHAPRGTHDFSRAARGTHDSDLTTRFLTSTTLDASPAALASKFYPQHYSRYPQAMRDPPTPPIHQRSPS